MYVNVYVRGGGREIETKTEHMRQKEGERETDIEKETGRCRLRDREDDRFSKQERKSNRGKNH